VTALDTLDPYASIDADDKWRAVALAEGHLYALEAAAEATDYPIALEAIRLKRGIVKRYLRWINESDMGASNALGMLGENGHAPGIRSVCDSARYHGFVWRERRDALRNGDSQ
jgi:hypothetical protein